MNWSRQKRIGASSTGIASGMWIASLTIALTFLFLAGCSPRSVVVMDSRLTAPCERPELQGNTNRDVWRLAVEQQEALMDCADRIDAIRKLTRGH